MVRDSKPYKNPRVLAVGFLWLFGLYAVFLSPAPIRLTEERLQRFETKLKELEKVEKPMRVAEQKWMDAQMSVQASKVSLLSSIATSSTSSDYSQ